MHNQTIVMILQQWILHGTKLAKMVTHGPKISGCNRDRGGCFELICHLEIELSGYDKEVAN